MAFTARVYLQQPGKTEASYLGEIDLDVRPILNGRASFMLEGRVVVGHIDTLAPPNWAETGAIPTIHVVQR
jgi:hypothetical protein